MTSSLAASGAPRHLSQSVAQELDALLMAPLARGGAGFTNEQLMELSGLVTAQALLHAHPRARRVAVLVGPGNNGGDALVAARHLAHFRVHTEIHFPKRKSAADAPHIARLTEQCVALQLPFLDAVSAALLQTFDVVLDGIFGFSYTPSADGVVRAPFDGVIAAVNQCTVPVLCIDVPSGWHVDTGDATHGVRCDTLVSLTTPKLCALKHVGAHYLGGRFVPPSIAEKFDLQLPTYAGVDQFVKLT